MYKAYNSDFPQRTSTVTKFITLSFLVAVNTSSAGEIMGPGRPREKTSAHISLCPAIERSASGLVKSSLEGETSLEGMVSLDEVAKFWASVDDDTVFDGISEETWAMIDELVANNPSIADRL